MFILALLVVLLGPAVYFTAILGGIQVRRLRVGLRLALRPRRGTQPDGELTMYQSLAMGLAGGPAIAGVAAPVVALLGGGPGTIPWLILGAVLGMALLYAEALLGRHYREMDPHGAVGGGAMYYASEGIGGTFGRFLAGTFALGVAVAALGVSWLAGGYTAGALDGMLAVPPAATGVVIATVLGITLRGGVRWIGRALGFVVPVLLALWLLWAGASLVGRWGGLGDAVAAALRGAFLSPSLSTIGVGVAVGLVSTFAGAGMTGIIAGASQARSAPQQGTVAITQAFLGSVVIGSVTGLLLVAGMDGMGAVATPAWASRPPVAQLVLAAFSLITAWAYLGDRAAAYLFGVRATVPYRLLLLVATFASAAALQARLTGSFGPVATITRIAGAVMLLCNTGGILLLTGVVTRETRREFGGGGG